MPLVEEGDKSRRELGWLVLLHEMASPGDYLEACTGDAGGELLAAVGGDPRVVAAPADHHGKGDGVVSVLDLVGVALVGAPLRNLAVEGQLAAAVKPWLDEGIQGGRVQASAAGRRHV